MAVLLLPLSTQSCCYFFPCDYFLNVDGIILGSENKPIAGAQVEAKPFHNPQDIVYNSHFKTQSRSDGCFRFDGFSVPPKEWVPLTVVAPGYKSVAEQVPGTGSNHVIITLVPQGSDTTDSKVVLVPSEVGTTPFPQCKAPCAPCKEPADSK